VALLQKLAFWILEWAARLLRLRYQVAQVEGRWLFEARDPLVELKVIMNLCDLIQRLDPGDRS
jgi:hypothetical protein